MSISRFVCLVMCLGLGLSFSVAAGGRSNLVAQADKSKRTAEDERQIEENSKAEGLQQTLNLNFSPEHREKLRKALEDYAEFSGFECEVLLLPDFGTAKKSSISSLTRQFVLANETCGDN